MITPEQAKRMQAITGKPPGGAVGAAQTGGKPPELSSDDYNSQIDQIVSQHKAKQTAAPPVEGGKGFLDTVGNAVGKVGQSFGDFNIGGVKGLGSSVLGAAELGSKALESGYNATIGKLTGKKALEGSQEAENLKEKYTTPTNAAESIGKTAEQLGEFFVPLGGASKAVKAAEGVEKIAAGGAKLAGEAEKAVPLAEKAVQFGKNALGLGKKAATEAFEQGARTAVQTGKVDDRSVSAAAIGGLMPVVGSALGLAKGQLPKLARKLEEVNLRLTPAQKRTMTQKIDDVTDYMVKNKMTGTANKRLAKVTAKYDEMEPALDSFLRTEAKDRLVPKQDVLDDLEKIKTHYQDRVDSDAIEGQIDRIMATVNKKQGTHIAPLNLNKLKRSAYDSAYNESGNKVLDDVMHDVGDTLRKRLETATEGLSIKGKNIADFNKDYATLINARKLLKVAASRKDVGFLAKLVSSGVGGLLGSHLGPIGGAVGAAVAPGVAETVAGTLPRSLISAGLEKAGNVGISEGTKTLGKGITSQAIQNLGQ